MNKRQRKKEVKKISDSIRASLAKSLREQAKHRSFSDYIGPLIGRNIEPREDVPKWDASPFFAGVDWAAAERETLSKIISSGLISGRTSCDKANIANPPRPDYTARPMRLSNMIQLGPGDITMVKVNGRHVLHDEIILDLEIVGPPPDPNRINCPSCGALVGQRDPVTKKEIAQWSHKGPCGAPCAGRRFRRGKEGRKHPELHTRSKCPRCAPKPCPACLGKCTCNYCAGSGRVKTEHARPGDLTGDCRCSYPIGTFNDYSVPIVCAHHCARCSSTGKVHGLEADA